MKSPLYYLAVGFGSGLMPKAPGTFGTLAAIPFYLLFCQFSWILQSVIIFTSFIAGIFFCEYSANLLGVHDHPSIVWDEFVGYWATMLILPLTQTPVTLAWILLGFIGFRLFDIIKPWPIGWVDARVSGGLGIMLDDLLAAGYAGCALWLSIVLISKIT